MTTDPHLSSSWIVAAVAATAVVAGCGSGSASEGEPVLQSVSVERRTVEKSVEATGKIEPIKTVEVKSLASGEILEMVVDLGDRVQRGELLLRIDPRDVQNELEQAQADLQQAEAQLKVASSRLERAQALRDSGVVTQQELETAILEHANAQSSHQRARSRLELARERREDATINAPITGTVIEKLVEEGQAITSTNSVTGGTVLLRMADLSDVQVRTLVDESDIGGIQPGMPASISVEAFPDQQFSGEVLKIEPQATVEQNVTMFAVLTRIGNEGGRLKPGMNGDVEIVLGREENVLAIPNTGIKMPGEARQLVQALGMDESLLDAPAPALASADGGGSDVPGSAGSEGGAADGSGQEEAGGDDEIPTPEEIRDMSQEERREAFQELSDEQRRQLMQRMRAAGGFGGPGGGDQARRAADSGEPRKAFVFRRGEDGALTVEPVTIGLTSWEYTEIVDGLEEGESVLQVPLALVQQQELLQRFRDRSGVPGMGGG